MEHADDTKVDVSFLSYVLVRHSKELCANCVCFVIFFHFLVSSDHYKKVEDRLLKLNRDALICVVIAVATSIPLLVLRCGTCNIWQGNDIIGSRPANTTQHPTTVHFVNQVSKPFIAFVDIAFIIQFLFLLIVLQKAWGLCANIHVGKHR